jgi:hypothetical protein
MLRSALSRPNLSPTAPTIDWRWPVAVLLGTANGIALANLWTWQEWRTAADWMIYPALADAVTDGTLYVRLEATDGTVASWRYSPVAAKILAVVAADRVWWLLAHIAACCLMPPRLALITLLSWPFWVDTAFGDVFVFVMVAAVVAMRGNRLGVLAYYALTLLMPRPLQLPLLLWLLWKEPWSRPWFAIGFAGHAVLVLVSGYAGQWMERLIASWPDDPYMPLNFGPTQFVGYWWFLASVPLAVWLWSVRKPAAAGLVLSPYILGQYWLFALAEFGHGRDAASDERAR